MSETGRHNLPHLTVAVVVKQEGRYLMVQEYSADGASVLNQPAGHVEGGETLLEAALRETLEETAWTVELDAMLGIYTYSSAGICYQRVCFSARAVKETNGSLDPAIQAAHWLSREQIEHSALRSPLVMQAIDDYERGERFALTAIKSTKHLTSKRNHGS